jgi:hypothetical protein
MQPCRGFDPCRETPDEDPPELEPGLLEDLPAKAATAEDQVDGRAHVGGCFAAGLAEMNLGKIGGYDFNLNTHRQVGLDCVDPVRPRA